jgi:hypothetical protein
MHHTQTTSDGWPARTGIGRPSLSNNRVTEMSVSACTTTTPLPSATAATARSYGVAEYPHRYPGHSASAQCALRSALSALCSLLCALHPRRNILSSLTSTIDPTVTSLVSRLPPSRTPLSFNGNTNHPRHALHAGLGVAILPGTNTWVMALTITTTHTSSQAHACSSQPGTTFAAWHPSKVDGKYQAKRVV